MLSQDSGIAWYLSPLVWRARVACRSLGRVSRLSREPVVLIGVGLARVAVAFRGGRAQTLEAHC